MAFLPQHNGGVPLQCVPAYITLRMRGIGVCSMFFSLPGLGLYCVWVVVCVGCTVCGL
jgi:hypothetical protein